jgi:tRNA modification GTPase
LDLLQAEAVREFVDAQTDLQARTALRQLEGSVSKRVEPVKQKLVEIIAHLEAGIDFAEDDVDVPSNASAARDIHSIEGMLDSLQRTFGYGKILAKGLKLVILGKPNVGKSSLFNRLVAADRAIVTEVPGTTRDVLTETISIDGVPVRFADTAGMHETADPVERIGVTRSLETLVDSDFGLVVLDGSSPLDASDWTVLGKASRIPHLIVINKTDLPQSIELDGLNGSRRVRVSAKTGHGFDELQESLRAFVVAQKSDLVDDSILTSARQFDTVTKILQSLSRARESLESQVPHEMVLLDLYDALAAIGDLTGEVVTEDILSKIFSTFCIGK